MPDYMKVQIEKINIELKKYIQSLNTPESLRQAMDYSLQAGAKNSSIINIFNFICF